MERGIRVNAVAPGPVWTPLNVQSSDPEHVKESGQDVAMERPAQPEELAPAYVFLASNIDSSYISGEVLPVLGGETVAGWLGVEIGVLRRAPLKRKPAALRRWTDSELISCHTQLQTAFRFLERRAQRVP